MKLRHETIPFRLEKKDARDLHHNSLKTDSYMTKYSCSDHHRSIKHQPQGPVNPLQLSNRPQPRYIPLFQRQKQGARQRAWEGQISTNAVISRHDCRIEFCNLLQSCKPPFVRYENKLQNSIRQSWWEITAFMLIWPSQARWRAPCFWRWNGGM